MTTYHYSQEFTTLAVSGNTPYGIFDNEDSFVTDVQNYTIWSARKLGYPTIKIELSDEQFYGSYEEATLKYNEMVLSNEIQNWFIDYFGRVSDSGSNITNEIRTTDYAFLRRLLQPTVKEVGGNTNVELYTGSFEIRMGQNACDLKNWSTVSESGASLTINKVWYQKTPAMIRGMIKQYYGSDILRNDFEGYSPTFKHYNHIIHPVFTNILMANDIEQKEMMYRGEYSYILNNNVIKITPPADSNLKIWFSYYKDSSTKEFGIDYQPTSVTTGSEEWYANNMANIPFQSIEYKTLNEFSKNWIRQYGFATIKEILGNVRGKFQAVPSPAGEITLDSDYLRTSARDEKNQLILTLSETLAEMKIEKLLEMKAILHEHINRYINKFAFPIPITFG